MTNYLQPLEAMQAYFETGETLSYAFRRKQLLTLKKALSDFEAEIYAALYTDLKKSKEECWVTENGFVTVELNNALRNLKNGCSLPAFPPTY